MGSDKQQEKGISLAKAAAQDPAISDYRKSTRTFAVVARGGLTAADTDELSGALLFDYWAGKANEADCLITLKTVDAMIKHEDNLIKREDMALKVELRQQVVKRLKSRSELNAVIAEGVRTSRR